MSKVLLSSFLVTLSVWPSPPAQAQMQVTDDAVIARQSAREDATSDIDDVDQRHLSASQGLSCAQFRPGQANDAASASTANPQIVSRARQIAREEGVDEALFLSLIYQESRFNACATSSAGAIGLTQLMPATAADLGIDPYDVDDNLRGGARYLKQQLSTFHGDTTLALAAYNAGPGNVQAYGGVPPFKETESYVTAITQRWLPSLGGEASGNKIPVASGGGTAAFVQSRARTLSAAGRSMAISDGSSDIVAFWATIAAIAPGTIHQSWDHNSTARSANVEMINQMVSTAAMIADLVNARRLLAASGLSGSAQAVRSLPQSSPPKGDTLCNGDDGSTGSSPPVCANSPSDTDDMELKLSFL
ncbi:lytic transglycosylase domain-containing protein [Neorhizobium sp. NCHU2750]|uniref:lytic transglycosylase domain-containing protein n=1 Tax=Neorhizobium sp. NCHU2750 TaxID=1825976 RepID=UPI000EB76429|nr:lytic transglycosylase [Neorhizobium sp. NCHU2750]